MSEPRGPVYMAVPQETATCRCPAAPAFRRAISLALRGRCRQPWRTHARSPIGSCMPTIRASIPARSAMNQQAITALVQLADLLALPYMEDQSADRMNFPADSPFYGTGPEPKDADVLLIFEHLSPYAPGRESPAADAKIAWISIDPVLSRFKTIEYRADLWIPASSARVARAVYEAATSMLTNSDMTRIAARRERLERRKLEMDDRARQLAERDLAEGRLNGRTVGYTLGQLLEPDAIVLNDGLSNGPLVQTYARRSRVGTYFRSGSSSGGWGSGAAFGVKLARPDQDVVLVSGDGYYTFGSPMPALWAARFHSAAYLSIVFANGTYSTGTSSLARKLSGGLRGRRGLRRRAVRSGTTVRKTRRRGGRLWRTRHRSRRARGRVAARVGQRAQQHPRGDRRGRATPGGAAGRARPLSFLRANRAPNPMTAAADARAQSACVLLSVAILAHDRGTQPFPSRLSTGIGRPGPALDQATRARLRSHLIAGKRGTSALPEVAGGGHRFKSLEP